MQRAEFLEDAPEFWRRREAHGSIRIQEEEAPSFAADLHHSIIVSQMLMDGRLALSNGWRDQGGFFTID